VLELVDQGADKGHVVHFCGSTRSRSNCRHSMLARGSVGLYHPDRRPGISRGPTRRSCRTNVRRPQDSGWRRGGRTQAVSCDGGRSPAECETDRCGCGRRCRLRRWWLRLRFDWPWQSRTLSTALSAEPARAEWRRRVPGR
jgi:hypothetical protein